MGFFSKLFGPPARELFARSVVDALRQDGISDPIAFDESAFALRIGDGISSRVLHLEGLLGRLQREQIQDRDEILRAFIRRYRESSAPKSFRDAQQRLLPHLRGRADFSFSNLMARADGLQRDDRPFRLLTEEIGIGLMLDDAEMMRGVDQEQLASWGVAEDEAMRVALDNLRARTDPQFQQQQAGLWVSAWRDGYDATRILLPDVVSDLAVRGRPVIVLPHANLLVVTGDGDPAGLVAMAGLAASAFEQAQPISVTPLVREGDAWQPLQLDDAHPAASAMSLLRLRLEVLRYDRQQELLAAEAIREGDEILIAPFIGTRDRQTGAYFSHCAWREDFRQSLPRTDRVGFVSDDRGPRGFADWVDVLRVMGPAIKPTNDYPPRYAVETFPTEAQMRDMGISPVDS